MDPAPIRVSPGKGETMRMTKSLLLGISTLALATGAAFAGEDSTHRWHGTGPEYHETVGGLNLFSDADAVGADEFSEPVITEAYDVYYIIYPADVESVTLVPSIDAEMSRG